MDDDLIDELIYLFQNLQISDSECEFNYYDCFEYFIVPNFGIFVPEFEENEYDFISINNN